MIRKILLSVLYVTIAANAASMIGLEALGKPTEGASAIMLGRGYAGGAKTGSGITPWNPASLAFEESTSFNATMVFEENMASHRDDSYASSTLEIPSLSFVFAMYDFGTLALSLSEKYTSNLDEEVSDSSATNLANIQYKGSVYELTPSYAVRLPFLRRFSLGFSAHFVMGSVSRSLTLGGDNSAVAKSDAWATNNSEITESADGSWEIKNHPAYYTGALHYKGRRASYYFSYTTAYTLKNEIEYNLKFSETDTLVPTKLSREIEVPPTLATGFAYRFKKKHNIMLDFMLRGWNADICNIGESWNLEDSTDTQTEFLAALGYERSGSTDYFKKYVQRMDFRLGIWYRNYYISDVTEFGAGIGSGFPLGRRSTKLDVAIQAGVRKSDNDSIWDEKFVGIAIGLTGVGNWGNKPKKVH
jgi:long-chain fatty acid transport protein